MPRNQGSVFSLDQEYCLFFLNMVMAVPASRFSQKKLTMLISPPSKTPSVNGAGMKMRLIRMKSARIAQLSLSSFCWRGSFSMGFTL